LLAGLLLVLALLSALLATALLARFLLAALLLARLLLVALTTLATLVLLAALLLARFLLVALTTLATLVLLAALIFIRHFYFFLRLGLFPQGQPFGREFVPISRCKISADSSGWCDHVSVRFRRHPPPQGSVRRAVADVIA
jgi:hypothetical protein